NGDFADWFQLYGYESGPEARTELRSAKELSRVLGVTYDELVQLVQTRFVNPNLTRLDILWKLRLDVGDFFRYFTPRNDPAYADETAAFVALLDALDHQYDAIEFDALAELENLWNDGVFSGALLLRDWSLVDAGSGAPLLCDFEHTSLEYADNARDTGDDSH